MPIYRQPRTSIPAKGHRIYPYLLRNVSIERPNQVWCADVTYIPLAKGFLYQVAIMDWWSREVLAWRLSNTIDVQFCFIERLWRSLKYECIYLHVFSGGLQARQGIGD